MANEFVTYFNRGSFLPVILFFLGISTLLLFSINQYSYGCMVLLGGFIIYITNNVVVNRRGFSTEFNEYLEELASYLTFSITTIVFGFVYFQANTTMIIIISLYAISQFLAFSRNWILHRKNSMGWPIALNGIFFPLSYYLVTVVVQGFDTGIFLLYYLIITILSISDKNFIGTSKLDQYDVLDEDS